MAKKISETHTSSFVIRITPSLHKKLTAAASESGRSLNSEIFHRLERSFVPLREDAEMARTGFERMAQILERAGEEIIHPGLKKTFHKYAGEMRKAKPPKTPRSTKEEEK